MTDSPFYCDLTALTDEQRESYQALIPRMVATYQGIEDLPNGYRLPFTAGTEQLLITAEFISFEKLCCPFLDFSVRVTSNSDQAHLDITGPEGVKDFLQAELGGVLQANLDA
ncbi:MAG: hypothetical protein DWQ07_06255 [Chloroflexi bacterium]|nr:MAG: hypothetical protein DWQ07_06255 [Chloroflexota bacterium]MBL1195968.1 hypothetical protein [Chloroflexota bacterium]NOH13262.1 hypothetical protein [Chloroflexota bacterium]